MSQPGLFDAGAKEERATAQPGEQGGREWSHVTLGADTIRYRRTPGEHAHYGAGWEIEARRDGVSSEWKRVISTSAADWFAFGYAAGRTE